MAREPILIVEGLSKDFPVAHGRRLQAVVDVDLTVLKGETLGVVGESGSGKTTLGRLMQPTAGRVHFQQRDITTLTQRQLRPLRRDIQMIFQDPYSSLNPRMRVDRIIGEPLRALGVDRVRIRERVAELLEVVKLPAD